MNGIGCVLGWMQKKNIGMQYDLLMVGDNFLCEGTLQTHSFEGRNYQLGDIKIGNNCSVGAMSIILKGVYISLFLADSGVYFVV